LRFQVHLILLMIAVVLVLNVAHLVEVAIWTLLYSLLGVVPSHVNPFYFALVNFTTLGFDERTGRVMNPSLAEYHVPVHLDVPEIDVIWNDIPDPHSPLGLHGIREIALQGRGRCRGRRYNATGKRIRELPITLHKVMMARS
jgi:hypothetical protein